MADPFVAEIRIFPFNFAPKGWAWCNGQLLPISQNTALFSLLGTTYGGDGKSNFALPDFQGNAPLGRGQGGGLSLYDLGQIGGSATVTLLTSEIPLHVHAIQATVEDATTPNPSGAALASSTSGLAYTPTPTPLVALSGFALHATGGDSPHNNMQPYLVLSFCIALQGIYPPRNVAAATAGAAADNNDVS